MNKKIILFAMFFLMTIICFTGCGINVIKELSFTDINEVEGFCDCKVMGIEASSVVKPSIPGEYYNFYDTKDDNLKYLSTELLVTNLSKDNLKADKVMNVQYSIGDIKYPAASVVETEDGSQLIDSEKINMEVGGKAKLIFVSKVPVSVLGEDIIFEADIDGSRYKMEFNLKDIELSRKYEDIGTEITGSDDITIKFKDISSGDVLEPSDTSGQQYRSFKAKDDKHSFIIANATVSNKGREAVTASSEINVRYVSGDKYDSTKLVEISEGKDIDYLKNKTIAEGAEENIIFIMEVPKEAIGTDGYIEVDFKDRKFYLRFPQK